MRRILWVGALSFAIWELLAVVHWVGAAGSVGLAASLTWTRLSSDSFLLIVLTDHLAIAGSALVWVWIDATRSRWSVLKRLGWVVSFIALGTPALLAYLAERRVVRDQHSAAAP